MAMAWIGLSQAAQPCAPLTRISYAPEARRRDAQLARRCFASRRPSQRTTGHVQASNLEPCIDASRVRLGYEWEFRLRTRSPFRLCNGVTAVAAEPLRDGCAQSGSWISLPRARRVVCGRRRLDGVRSPTYDTFAFVSRAFNVTG